MPQVTNEYVDHRSAFAARHGRVLVSHDVNTMPQHFREFIRAQQSPGLILIPQRLAIGAAMEELELLWDAPRKPNSRTASSTCHSE